MVEGGRRLQLGISRGSPEQVIDGGATGWVRRHRASDAITLPRGSSTPRGDGFAKPNPQPMFANPPKAASR